MPQSQILILIFQGPCSNCNSNVWKLCYSKRSWFWRTFQKVNLLYFSKPNTNHIWSSFTETWCKIIVVLHLLKWNDIWFLFENIKVSLLNDTALSHGFRKNLPIFGLKSFVSMMWAKCITYLTLYKLKPSDVRIYARNHHFSELKIVLAKG